MKVKQGGNGVAGTAAPIEFQIGDIRTDDMVHNSTPWSGYSGKTFSSHVKQAAVHAARAAAMDGVNGLLDPTGDAEVCRNSLCLWALPP